MTFERSPHPPLLGIAAERVARPDGRLDPGVVWVDTELGTIADVVRGEGWGPAGARPEDVPVHLVELGDRTLAPGFVDVHVHGGAGHQTNGDTATAVAESLAAVAAFHAQHGTTSLLATTVSDSPERLVAAVSGAAMAASRPPSGGARVIGVHVEGPFISPVRAGAQDPAWIRPPDRTELSRLLELGAGTVRIVTLAPELDGAGELITLCLEADAVVALGHSDADVDAAKKAFDAGATHATHLFDAMAPFHHRHPGLATAALLDERVTIELICDLHHVHPAAIELVARTARGRIVLVTDAGPAAGLPPGRHVLGGRAVELAGTLVTLAADASVLAGSALTMERAVRHAVNDAHVPLVDALAAASAVPAAIARASDAPHGAKGAGSLEPGAAADLVVLDATLEVVATLVAGSVVHDPGRLID